MRNLIYSVISLLLFIGPLNVCGQQTELKLSLKDALEKANESNRKINKAREQGNAAKADYRQSNAIFLPNLNLSHTAVSTNDPLSAFGFKLKQEITTQADFNPVLLNDPDHIENFNTKISVQQPIINLDGLYARKAAHAKMQAVNYGTQRTIYYTKFEVKKAYYQLELAQESVNVYQKSLETAQSALQLTKDNLKQGYVKEADLLAAKVRVLELSTQLADAENARKQAGEFLAYILGIDIETPITTTDRLERKPVLLQGLGSNVNTGRSDVLAYQKGVEARENMLKSERMNFLPRLNAFGAYEWNDDHLFGTTAKNYMIGARLSWNLFGGYKNIAKVQKGKAELKIAKLELADYESKNRMQISAAKRNLQVAYDRIDMSKLAKEQAEEAYRIRNNRYQQGLEKTVDLLQAESASLLKNLEFINALYQYHMAMFQLELLLEKDLQ